MIEILHNGKIYTDIKKGATCSAIAICNGQILACGENNNILSTYNKDARITDLQKRTVLPGFTDAHIHFQRFALQMSRINCEVASLDSCLDLVKAKAADTLPGEWVLGHGWNQNLWGGIFGNRTQLDVLDNNHPIYLTAKSLHAGWCNSKALAVAGINARTSNPEGGVIQRDQSGEPTGILFESAMRLVENAIPPIGPEALKTSFLQAQIKLNQMGFTGMHDFDGMDCFSTLEELLLNDQLHLRTVKNIPIGNLDDTARLGISSGFGHPMLTFGAVKLFSDGALGPHTAAMLQPYEETDNLGMLLLSEAEILEIGVRAAKTKLPLAIHAIGDRAVRTTLLALNKLIKYQHDHRLGSLKHRIEHLQLIAPSDLEYLRGSGIIASMQPYHMVSDQQIADRYWGKRSEYSYAWKSVADTGAIIAFGSDAPVETPNPFLAIHAAITRRMTYADPSSSWYPDQCLSIRDALAAYTSGSAFAVGQETTLGKLLPGYVADLAVFHQDPAESPTELLPAFESSATMVSGNWVWKGL